MNVLLKKIIISSIVAFTANISLAQSNHYNEPEEVNFEQFNPNQSEINIKANVVNVKPIYSYVTINTPTKHCFTEPVTQTYYNDEDRASRALLGGLIGGVIGNNIGHGNSRKTSAVLGALIGSQIGSRIADNHAYATQQVRYEQRCEIQNVSETIKKITAYDVSYQFRGRIFTTQMPYHPGSQISLNLSLTPSLN